MKHGEGGSALAGQVVFDTPHAFKGLEAEVVLVVAADRFAALPAGEARVNALFVALTRARGVLEVFATDAPGGRATDGGALVSALRDAADRLPLPDDAGAEDERANG